MNLIQELMALNEEKPQDNSPAWYVVRIKDDAISAGPFDTKPTDGTLRTLQWYNHTEYTVEQGTIDETFTDFDKFKDAK